MEERDSPLCFDCLFRFLCSQYKSESRLMRDLLDDGKVNYAKAQRCFESVTCYEMLVRLLCRLKAYVYSKMKRFMTTLMIISVFAMLSV